ncbi:unnamed protein product [Trichobilharzia szidati]|nr:unnamed protein product [Trichobilharzia szidati]
MSSNQENVSFDPVKWSEYFNIRDDIELEGGTFRIYRRGVEGPLLFFLHGGGFSALTWAVLSVLITEQVKCQCLAVDMRGHGDTKCSNDDDFSVDTLSKDIIKIIFAMYPMEAPPIILVGHSMGGAVAVHVACKRTIPSLAGIVVIDVVEGTALSSLRGMTAFLRSRPQSFRSLPQAIEWSVRSMQIRNVNSARVSFPGQLKRISSGQTATSELDEGIAFISENVPPIPVNSVSDSRISSVSRLSSQPLVENSESDEEEGECECENFEVSTDVTDSQHVLEHNHNSLELPKHSNIDDSLQSEKLNHASLSSNISNSTGGKSHHPINNDNDSSTNNNEASSFSTPSLSPLATSVSSQSNRSQYTWRIDLMKTQPFWQEWFSGLSKLFLSIPEPKLLLLADADRLDKDLMIGQMQGKFQVQLFPRTGHAVQEDAPDKVAECLARFLVRNRFTEGRSDS